ncbi:GntR family transcriptional regulator [Treponema primitia]|uniref:GntR family transcriptional regulator n=1 Tax=Treponema primitia TaxID=88058 RepID=UPI0039813838
MEKNDISPIMTYSTISDIVYKWIRNAIVSSAFKPGEWITQEDITERLHVSRTPVRDAFKRLQSEGLLVVKPHQGAIVVQLSLEKLIEVYEIRMLLEGAAAKHACENIANKNINELEKINTKMSAQRSDPQQFMNCNRNFHYSLYSFSKREYLISTIFGLWDLIEPYRLIYFSHDGKTDGAIEEHIHIIKALKKHHPEEVRQAVIEHLNDVVTTLSSNGAELVNIEAPIRRKRQRAEPTAK